MKLELGKIYIHDVQFADKTYVENGTLFVCKEEIEKLVLEDDRLISARVELARPGESVRIAPVKDVIEPRVKVDGPGAIFPGVINKVKQVGEGRTHALVGSTVITCGRIVGFQEGVIDMSGPTAKYTPFSETYNVCVVIEPKEGLETHDYEAAGRMAGLKVATYVGEAGRNVEPDEIVTYETKPLLEQIAQYPDLPKIGYVHMLQSQGLLHDTFYYGVDAKKFIPTLMYPTEIMDGAIVSGNCVAPCDKVTTYHHLNNPVIEDLYKRHGKDLNFIGVILTNENVFLADKERCSDMVAKLAQFIGLDGLLITEEGYGNPDTDLMMNCKKVTQAGTKVVIITDEFPGRDGKSQSLADAVPEADTMVSCGQGNIIVHFPAMDHVIGTLDFVETMIGGYEGCIKADGSFDAELQIIIASTIANGFNKLAARTY
ncbi:sarcosine reductase complex component B subunit alpha [Bariatricus massiliensis]|uniref:Glycine/sarcosine/betaine reductase component B subunit n=1 Tax=Bariatricus massiliensis TaxID=1745713 RepID=A0ABS8DFF8_9FIRM|nr:sarcosine reductase complex component B subunit alpha [Bariatricus massiliensis]MCB7302643.1 glycine/sarcosine/betaine reductase component B subunit [Bariatricus massiliensis]MCB7373859.1 glycine/sarcosine/betaine reductase component B subunit [Bariatricus massiliensis]MCB7386529.1 glycine/sarcosine/betaine reductase component B subunit [Bariatricus massiliensis]MCB7410691.1 glycine/sarcosine/betaine reductase component B subunit [Bariatricus massiliensis]MCQ5253471.1 sarcosine reductase co